MSDFKFNFISVIVPVYNEVQNLEKILKLIISEPTPKEIILINDASTDGTTELLKQIELKFQSTHHQNTQLKVIYHQVNKGKGAAVRTGIEHATGEIVLIQDADLEYDPSDYKNLISPIINGETEVVYGSRFLGDLPRNFITRQLWANKILTCFSNLLTGLKLTDMETCYKVIKRPIIQSFPLRSERFGIEPEITIKLVKLNHKIFEVPISFHARTHQEGKKINWKDGISAIYTMLKFWLIDDLKK
ncbi:MAG: glycosyltransferase family 2 protein [Elusimicrobiota bacterium]